MSRLTAMPNDPGITMPEPAPSLADAFSDAGFPGWLRQRLPATRIGRDNFARAHGISPHSLDRWLHGDRPNPHNIDRLAAALGVLPETISAFW